MAWMTLDQFFTAIEKPKCRHCDRQATYFAGKTEPVYCDNCFMQRFGDVLKLSDETPSDNSAS